MKLMFNLKFFTYEETILNYFRIVYDFEFRFLRVPGKSKKHPVMKHQQELRIIFMQNLKVTP